MTSHDTTHVEYCTGSHIYHCTTVINHPRVCTLSSLYLQAQANHLPRPYLKPQPARDLNHSARSQAIRTYRNQLKRAVLTVLQLDVRGGGDLSPNTSFGLHILRCYTGGVPGIPIIEHEHRYMPAMCESTGTYSRVECSALLPSKLPSSPSPIWTLFHPRN